MKPEEFDKEFLASLEAETKKTVDGFDDWQKQLKDVAELVQGRRTDDAVIKEGTAIRDLYPGLRRRPAASTNCWPRPTSPRTTSRPRSPSWSAMRRSAAAIPESLKKLAKLLEEAGTQEGSRRTLERLELDLPDGRRAAPAPGRALARPGQRRRARSANIRRVLAQQAASIPPQAHYNLARAYHAESTRTSRRRTSCCRRSKPRPGFRPAQKLLLELSAESVARTKK